MAPNLTLRSSNFLIRRSDLRYASKSPGQAKIDYLRYYILWNESVGITFALQYHLNTMKEGVSNMKITFTREGLIGLSSTILSLLLLFGLLSVTWIRTKLLRWVEIQRGRMGKSCGPFLITKTEARWDFWSQLARGGEYSLSIIISIRVLPLPPPCVCADVKKRLLGRPAKSFSARCALA